MPSAAPGGREKEIVAAICPPWWLTVIGVVPGMTVAKDASGTIVSWFVLTAAPDDEFLLPEMALMAVFVALSRATVAVWLAAVVALLETEPAASCVAPVPLDLPPDVLT